MAFEAFCASLVVPVFGVAAAFHGTYRCQLLTNNHSLEHSSSGAGPGIQRQMQETSETRALGFGF